MKLFIFFAILAVALSARPRKHFGKHADAENANAEREAAETECTKESVERDMVNAFIKVHQRFFNDSGCSLADFKAVHDAKEEVGRELQQLGCQDDDDKLLQVDDDEEDEVDAERRGHGGNGHGGHGGRGRCKPGRGGKHPKEIAEFVREWNLFKKHTNLTLSPTCTTKAIVKGIIKWHKNGKVIHRIFEAAKKRCAAEIGKYERAVGAGMKAAGKLAKQRYAPKTQCSMEDLGKITHFFKKVITHVYFKWGRAGVEHLANMNQTEVAILAHHTHDFKCRAHVRCHTKDILYVLKNMYMHGREIQKLFREQVHQALVNAGLTAEDKPQDVCGEFEEGDENATRGLFEAREMNHYELMKELAKRENIARMNNLFRA